MKQIELTPITYNQIPTYVTRVTETLETQGFEAYVVGGCVRDLLIGREPKDWDVTTNATPDQIISLFPKTVYENTFGTVAVIFEDVLGETGNIVARETPESVTHETFDPLKAQSSKLTAIVEVTPYRLESTYSDFRHPDAVKFSQKLEDDLKRRDFTINAIAYRPSTGELVDLFKGQEDIKDKVIRAVGEAGDRFNEDALRMLRAVRFSTQLDFAIAHETSEAVSQNADLIKKISTERIRDEFEKMLMSPNPAMGIVLLQKFELLKHIVPELEEGVGCEQMGEHIFDVFNHLLHALQHAADKDRSLTIRIAALFHDIGKPRTRRFDATKAGGKGKYTFYGHEVIGARMAKVIMQRLKFSKEVTELATKLVRYHMFFSDTEAITLSAVRRTIVNIGREHIWELMQIRECDRVGMKKKEAPYRLRKYHAMIEEALRAPTSVGMLKIDGSRIIEMGEKPGPNIGYTLHALLEEVLEDPTKNTPEYLEQRSHELLALPMDELKKLGEIGKGKKEEVEEAEVKKLHQKHGV